MSNQKYDLSQIMNSFDVLGTVCSAAPCGNGHINDTFQITLEADGQQTRYVLQRINTDIFKDIDAVMDNIQRVTAHCRSALGEKGIQDLTQRVLTYVPARNGASYVEHESGCWRCSYFIENSVAYDIIETPALAYEGAKSFGAFQRQLVDVPGKRLVETLPHFHDTPFRYQRFCKAIQEDAVSRVGTVTREIQFIHGYADKFATVVNGLADGSIPERVTHNDTKLNNVLMDAEHGTGLCVIDLDTLMPGSSLYDFGDMVRSATNAVAEDEPDYTQVQMRMLIFRALLEGYMSEMGTFLSERERELLPFSAILITIEMGMRFLTDYLSGDKYYKIQHEQHNLDRCRTQQALVESMESQLEEMNALVQTCL